LFAIKPEEIVQQIVSHIYGESVIRKQKCLVIRPFLMNEIFGEKKNFGRKKPAPFRYLPYRLIPSIVSGNRFGKNFFLSLSLDIELDNLGASENRFRKANPSL
jgi:hypothetical protein